MKVITAKEGCVLRDFAHSQKDNKDISIFPESGLSPNEQASFLKDNAGKFTSVITFSPFIVSDASDLHVLDDKHANVQMGSSINKVTMQLWRRETIGDIAKDALQVLRTQSEKACTESELNNIITQCYELGDSVERVLFIHHLIEKIDIVKAQRL